MPIYEYTCDLCGKHDERLSEHFTSAKADIMRRCACGGTLHRKVPNFKWHFSNELIHGTKMEFSESTLGESIKKMQGR